MIINSVSEFRHRFSNSSAEEQLELLDSDYASQVSLNFLINHCARSNEGAIIDKFFCRSKLEEIVYLVEHYSIKIKSLSRIDSHFYIQFTDELLTNKWTLL